jgi:5-methylcytosine-specific restriction endonuclease McrA
MRQREIETEKRKESNNICYLCNNIFLKKELNTHHIVPFVISKNNSDDNLVVLCKNCHRKTDSKLFKYINENKELAEEEIKIYANKILQEN